MQIDIAAHHCQSSAVTCMAVSHLPTTDADICLGTFDQHGTTTFARSSLPMNQVDAH